MTTFTSPNCPKCGGVSTNPTRAGMSATPYKCTSCDHAFNLVVDYAALKLSDAEFEIIKNGRL